MSRQIILDTETTGLSPAEGHRIVEFAALELLDRRPTGKTLHLYINPERDIPNEVVEIHGITNERVKNEPVFAAVADQIIAFLAGAEILAHNAPFDQRFLDYELGLLGREPLPVFTDTLALAKERYPGQKNSLDALCTRLGVDRSKRVYHGALIDCELLCDVYLNMTRSQFSLDVVVAEEAPAFQGAVIEEATSGFAGKVVYADAAELAAHEAYLDGLDKAAGGSCVYRQPESRIGAGER